MGISTFTSTGKKVSGVRRAGLATSPLGKLDPTTGSVWQHPRIKQEPLSGGRVKITNPKASTTLGQNSMTGSLGMMGVGQRGRNRDVGEAKAPGEG